ncbi:hypothetical protein MML48_7g00004553 [Holotrichia oblita]|uniref:Uncharacterized protein n=1 Tax=Holotrichia oblita TaxID=644536 RepID=A0ACB9SW11_HOLOL|nr:hypothetical protein MML48_7g00004553 [Holotrichia oblita]
MFLNKFLVILLIATITKSSVSQIEVPTNETLEEGQQKVAEYVRAILNHYKQKDPVGLPGVPIPDPMDIPPLNYPITLGSIRMTNIKLYGLKDFRIHHVSIDMAKMIADVAVTMENLIVRGNYTAKTLLSSSKGPYTVKLKEVYGQVVAKLRVESEGYLEAEEIKTKINPKHIDMKFEGLGGVASFLQSIMNSLGKFIFDSIEPYISKQSDAMARVEINKRSREFPQRFPNSISPFDQVLSMARQIVRKQGYDPYEVPNYNTTLGMFSVEMTHTWLTGLSSFHRVGNISFVLLNNTFEGNMEIGTQRLEGRANWEMGIVGGLLSKSGTVKFTVEYVKVGIIIKQSMDTRNKPELEDIQLELGNIQVRFDGAGTLDYIVEFSVNVLPNVLRYQIMDALESPVKRRIQEELNYINVEEMIMENVEKYDKGDMSFSLPKFG